MSAFNDNKISDAVTAVMAASACTVHGVVKK